MMQTMTWSEITQVWGGEVSKSAWLAGANLKLDPTIEHDGAEVAIFAYDDDRRVLTTRVPALKMSGPSRLNLDTVSWTRRP